MLMWILYAFDAHEVKMSYYKIWQQKPCKYLFMENKNLFTLLSQYHACWCPGSLCRQGISSHGTDKVSQGIPVSAPEGLKIRLTMSDVILLISLK